MSSKSWPASQFVIWSLFPGHTEDPSFLPQKAVLISIEPGHDPDQQPSLDKIIYDINWPISLVSHNWQLTRQHQNSHIVCASHLGSRVCRNWTNPQQPNGHSQNQSQLVMKRRALLPDCTSKKDIIHYSVPTEYDYKQSPVHHFKAWCLLKLKEHIKECLRQKFCK